MELEALKKLVEEGNTALKAMREENDAREKQQDVLTDEKIARIQGDFAKSEQAREDKVLAAEAVAETLKTRVEELETAASRPGTGGTKGTEEALELEVKNFNDWAHGRITDGEYKAMSTDVATDGGYFVPTTTRDGIRERMFRSSPIRSLSTVEKATIYEEIVERGDLATAGTTEKGSRSETDDPDFHLITIDTHERYAMPKVTNRLLKQSTFDIAGYLERKAGKKFARDESEDFTTGDGTSKARGILTYDVATTADETRADFTMQYRATGVSADFAADPNGADVFIHTFYDMQEDYQAGATWLMNNLTAAQVAILKDSNGDYMMKETAVNSGGVIVRTIQGLPIRLAKDMPAIAANSLSVILGDFSNYIIVDPEQISTIVDPFTVKPHTLFHMTNLVGGGVVDFDAFKLIKFGTS